MISYSALRSRASTYTFIAFIPALILQYAQQDPTLLIFILVIALLLSFTGLYLSLKTLDTSNKQQQSVFIPLLIIYTGIIASTLPAAIIYGRMYLGEEWETLPWFSGVSGKLRFEKHVISPVPETIYNIIGGYTGYPNGDVITNFKFKGEFAKNTFLRNWWEVSKEKTLKDYRQFDKQIDADQFYKGKGKDKYLFIDQSHHKGILFVPWYQL